MSDHDHIARRPAAGRSMRRFQQVDVFSDEPCLGNPVAVVRDADGLQTDAMQRFAAWTNQKLDALADGLADLMEHELNGDAADLEHGTDPNIPLPASHSPRPRPAPVIRPPIRAGPAASTPPAHPPAGIPRLE